jgi:4-diphosphocytidyl-2-C-methyl-D-erythritol kinase
LNRLLCGGLSREELRELGSQLGSDVPFFFSSGSALIAGRGEIVTDVALPLNYKVLVVAPNFVISTNEAYANLRFYLTRFSTKSHIIDEIPGAGLFKAVERIGNDFQPMVLSWYPQLQECREFMLREGARCVALSGSGSAIFGLFAEAPDPELTTSISSRWGWQVYCLSPVRLIRE